MIRDALGGLIVGVLFCASWVVINDYAGFDRDLTAPRAIIVIALFVFGSILERRLAR